MKLLSAAAVSVLACAFASPAFGANVSVFKGGTYVDAGTSSSGEANNVDLSISSFGHSVTTFTGIAANDFASATAGADTLDVPEQENKCLTADLTSEARDVIRQFVSTGGQLVVHSNDSGAGCDASLLNDVFGYNLTPAAGGASDKVVTAANTEFANGPLTLPNNDATNGLDDTSLPAGAVPVYEAAGNAATVTVFHFGNGSIVDLGWDWWHSDPPTAGLQDGGWQSILDAAVRRPSVSVSDVTLPEGNSGSSNAAFAVTLSEPVSEDVSVHYATGGGTATSGSDYLQRSGVVDFSPGQTSKTVNVPVLGDTTVEPNEAFALGLSSPLDATLGTATGTGTVLNDDAPLVVPSPDTNAPSLTIAGVARTMKFSKFRHGVRVSVTPTEASALEFDLLGSARTATVAAAPNLVLASRTLGRASGKRTVTLKPSGKLLRNARKRFSVQLKVVATDESGNRKIVRRKIKVKR